MNKKNLFKIFSLVLLTFVIYMTSLCPVRADSNITINYSTSEVQQIPYTYHGYNGLDTPNSGFVYLEVNMIIKNNGYDSYNTNPYYFSVVANNIKYNYDVATSDLNWNTVDVLNGGTFTGIIAFQIPIGSTVSSMGYSGFDSQFQSYNIVWNSGSTSTTAPTPIIVTTTPNPTATPTVPEFSSWAVLPIFMLAIAVALMVRKRTK